MRWMFYAAIIFLVLKHFGYVDMATEKFQAKRAENAVVEMYATSWCGYCRQAREFMQKNNIPFMEYDIEKDAAAKARNQRLGGGKRTPVPFFVINGQTQQGFSEQRFMKFLASASAQ